MGTIAIWLIAIAVMLLAAVLMWGFKKVFTKYASDELYQKALEALREGVDKAQEEFVVWRKRSSLDGKLSADERKEAMQIAWKHAKWVAQGPVSELIQTWSYAKVNSLIKQLLSKEAKSNVVKVISDAPAVPAADSDADSDALSDPAENES